MSLPPLANFFALREPDPVRRHETLARLGARSEFAFIWEPAPDWLGALAPLPGGVPDSNEVRALGFVFSEGRDRIAGHERVDVQALSRLRDMTAQRPHDLVNCPGDFGFLSFGKDGGVTSVRSCGGLVPLYYALDGERIAVATRLEYIVRFAGRDFALDPLVNAICAGGGDLVPEGRTFFVGISALHKGHYVHLSPGTPARPRAYWDPRPQHESDLVRGTERPRILRELLLHNLERELDPNGDNLLSLSGGVDSSALAALAVRVVGRRVSALSFVPPESEEQAHELHFIETLANEVELHRRWTISRSAAEEVRLLLGDHRILYHVRHPVLLTLPRILEEAPVTVLFGGEGGDDVCGSRVTLPDWTAHTSFLQLITGLGRLPYGASDILRWTKHGLLRLARRPRMFSSSNLSRMIHPELRAEYRELVEQRRRELGRDPRPLAHLAMTTEDEDWLAQNWEAASALGVRRSFPFATREMLEFSFRSHPRDLLGPGTKKLLRGAVDGEVPAENLLRRDRGSWRGLSNQAQCLWEAPLSKGLDQILRDDWHPVPPEPIHWSEAAQLAQLAQFCDTLEYVRCGVELGGYSIEGWGQQWGIRVKKSVFR